MLLKRDPAMALVYYALLVLVHYDQSTTSTICTKSPIITGYSRPHGLAVSLYNVTWQPSSCQFRDLIEYRFQVIESCSTITPTTIYTGSNKTMKIISIQHCNSGNCYIRIRAELSDGSVSDYSPCVLINSQLLTTERYIQTYYQDVCVPIQGACDRGAVPEFFINSQHMLWPWPGTTMLYNVTITQNPRMYHFCFSNISGDIILSEFCYQDHLMNCTLCSAGAGQINFLSLTTISVSIKENEYRSTSILSPSYYTVTAGSVASITAPSVYATNLPIPIYEMKKESGPGMMSSDTTLVSITNPITQNGTKINFKPPLGAISIGVSCIALGIMILFITTTVIILHRKKCLSKNSQTENIYDEISLPDPIYHEIAVKVQKESEARIEMIGNDSYMTTTCVLLKNP